MSITGIGRVAGGALGGLIMVAAVATACGGGGSPGSPGTTSQAPPPPASTSQLAGTSVTADLSDFRITLSSQNLSPGTYIFHAVNTGRTSHSLVIRGPGMSDKALPSNLDPGQAGDLTVRLQAGDYELYCPVDGHKDAGMDLKVAVGGAAGGGATSPSMPPQASSKSGGGGY